MVTTWPQASTSKIQVLALNLYLSKHFGGFFCLFVYILSFRQHFVVCLSFCQHYVVCSSVCRENYSLCVALLPFCPFSFLPLPFPLSLLSSLVKFSQLSREDIFCFIFTFRFMCRYRQLSWCFSRLQRWQLWPSSLGDKLRLCPFWLQTLKLFNVGSLVW